MSKLQDAVESVAQELHVKPPGYRSMQLLMQARAQGQRSTSQGAYNARLGLGLQDSWPLIRGRIQMNEKERPW
jgi:hypothetical protein